MITEAFNTAIKGDADWRTFWEKNVQKFEATVATEAPAKRGRKPKSDRKAA